MVGSVQRRVPVWWSLTRGSVQRGGIDVQSTPPPPNRIADTCEGTTCPFTNTDDNDLYH